MARDGIFQARLVHYKGGVRPIQAVFQLEDSSTGFWLGASYPKVPGFLEIFLFIGFFTEIQLDIPKPKRD